MTPAFIASLKVRIPPGSQMAQTCGDPPVLSEAEHDFFHHADFDGEQSIIYEGPGNCEEDDATVVWPGPAPLLRQDALQITGDILFIGDGPQPAYIDFVAGCCDDPDDQYISSALFNNFPLSFIVRKDLLLPNGMTGFGAPMIRSLRTMKNAFALRDAPAVDDKPNIDFRHPEGNILSRYAPGTIVVAMAEWTDQSGQMWALVSVPDNGNTGSVEPQGLNYIVKRYDPANVGWIETTPGFFDLPQVN